MGDSPPARVRTDGEQISIRMIQMVVNHQYKEAMQLVREHPMEIGSFECESSLLLQLVLKGRKTDLQYLLDEKPGEKVIINNHDGNLLYFAVRRGHMSVVQYLLTKSDNPTDVDNTLSCAAGFGRVDIVTFMLENDGEQPNIDADHGAPLAFAAERGHLNVVKYLVDERNGTKADIHTDDERALQTAAENGHLPIVQFLVEKGADIHSRSDMVLWSAAINGYLPIVNYALEKGADATTYDPKTLLHPEIEFVVREAREKQLAERRGGDMDEPWSVPSIFTLLLTKMENNRLRTLQAFTANFTQ